jgi:hypothetical protein
LRTYGKNALQHGYLVESVWKFLIYTELAVKLHDALMARPPHYQPNETEHELAELVDRNPLMFERSFSIRLQLTVEHLRTISPNLSVQDWRRALSVALHQEVLAKLVDLLRRIVAAKHRVAILVDNLDKAWGLGQDVTVLVRMIFGLTGVAPRIREELGAERHDRDDLPVSVVVFLRSDIYAVAQETLQERDKVDALRIVWNDAELLLRMLDRRLEASMPRGTTVEEIWTKYFVAEIDDIPVRQFIVQNTMPRPRDVIYLAQAAIAEAVNHGHAMVDADDFHAASKAYSDFALRALVAEDDPKLGKLEAILYELAGLGARVPRWRLNDALKRAKVDDVHHGYYIDLLCDLSVLGIRRVDGSFEFPRDEAERRSLLGAARSIADRSQSNLELYSINPALWTALQIRPDNDGPDPAETSTPIAISGLADANTRIPVAANPGRPSVRGIWSEISLELAREILFNFRKSNQQAYRDLLKMTAASLRIRLDTLRKEPANRQATLIKRALAQVDHEGVGGVPLALWLAEYRRTMLIAFFDSLGISHINGEARKGVGPEPDLTRLAQAVSNLRMSFPRTEVRFCLLVFSATTGRHWGNLPSLIGYA